MSDDLPTGPEPPHVPDLDLLRRIGQGGFGEVWLAVNGTTGRLRAVKLIPLHTAGHADPAGREIVSLTHLEAQAGNPHANLLTIHHVGRTADHLFYIMEPADDISGAPASPDLGYQPATLTGRLARGPLPVEECLRTAEQLLAGLAHLHAAGMVHRDVKPANCLYVGGELKLADFGLLTAADPLVSRIGTLRYMPPDGRMDARADVYAAGLVIYEMLTGLPVQEFPRLGECALEMATDARLKQLNRLVLRACQGDPRLRFGDAREMLDQLRLIGPAASPPHAGARRRAIVVIAAMLLGLSAAAVAFWPGHSSKVDVNFITEPFEATIYLDSTELLMPDGRPYTTPCTVPDLPAGRHRVIFRRPGQPDRDAGEVDFAVARDITARWE